MQRQKRCVAKLFDGYDIQSATKLCKIDLIFWKTGTQHSQHHVKPIGGDVYAVTFLLYNRDISIMDNTILYHISHAHGRGDGQQSAGHNTVNLLLRGSIRTHATSRTASSMCDQRPGARRSECARRFATDNTSPGAAAARLWILVVL